MASAMTTPVSSQPGESDAGARGAIRCPHCSEMVRAGATFCPSCTRRVLGYARCSECHEPISTDARYCPYCTQRVRRFLTGSEAEAPALDIAVQATRTGSGLTGLSLPGLFRPSVIQLRDDVLFVRRAGGLLTSALTTEIALPDIEDVHSRRGMIWGAVEIVTRAGSIVVRGIPRTDAVRFANQIDTMLFRARNA